MFLLFFALVLTIGDFFAVVIASVVGLIAYFIIGTIVGSFQESSEQKLLDKKYENEMKYYNALSSEDKIRVEKELKRKEYINSVYTALYKKYKETEQRLDEMYSYGILNQKYWHNIAAVASIYEYLETGRCRSLEFDPTTGDQGAYNIFESELRLNHIITNTEIIIQKLDQIAQYQAQLVREIRSANGQIQNLITATNRVSQNLERNGETLERIESNSEITRYNAQCSRQELEYMNFMNRINGRY